MFVVSQQYKNTTKLVKPQKRERGGGDEDNCGDQPATCAGTRRYLHAIIQQVLFLKSDEKQTNILRD